MPRFTIDKPAANTGTVLPGRASGRFQCLLVVGALFRSLGWVVFLGMGLVAATGAEESNWRIEKSKHFLVHYMADAEEAKDVATRSERYYDAIAADLGFTRYGNFWLWERRVKILIYPTAEAFATACQAPVWAAGRANATRHEIAGYHQGGKGFVEGILPHEIAHLILNDFVGSDRLPLWVSEGFAQWEQFGRDSGAFDHGVQAAGRLPFTEWANFNVRREPDREIAERYYRQSASVVGFLIATFGGERFGRFCRALRDGKITDRALESAYPDHVPGLAQLEAAWVKYVEGVKK